MGPRAIPLKSTENGRRDQGSVYASPGTGSQVAISGRRAPEVNISVPCAVLPTTPSNVTLLRDLLIVMSPLIYSFFINPGLNQIFHSFIHS